MLPSMSFCSSLVTATFATSLFAVGDGEWPPLADPQWDHATATVINNPTPPGTGAFNPHLYLDRLELVIPEPYATWVTHWHGTWNGTSNCSGLYGGFYTDFAIGDVDNDGLQDDIVITQPGEAVFAAEIDFAAGTLTPLWLWLTPYATSSLAGNPSHPLDPDYCPDPPDPCNPCDPPPVYSCRGTHRNNPLIWNLVADGVQDDTNEVAFVGLDASDREVLYILQTLPEGGVCVIAESPPTTYLWQNRLGIARVRNTAFPRDVVVSSPEGPVHVWGSTTSPSCQAPGTLSLLYRSDPFATNSQVLAKQHACNWGDIDGDGFDEFCLNGIVDFVDDTNGDGEPEPTNGIKGVPKWQIMQGVGGASNGAHCDHIVLADWDPTRYGLEVYAVTERAPVGFWKEDEGTQHDHAWDTLWDADTGVLLDEWETAPAEDGQGVFAGNWTTTYTGIEAILSPKDLPGGGQVIPAGELEQSGSYVVATRVTPSASLADFELLAIDGSVYDGTFWYENPSSANDLQIRSGGPWRQMWSMDWDGDYATDEILHHPLNMGNLILWRLRDKDDLVLGAYPPGIPTETQVQNPVPPIPGGYWYFYYQGLNGEHIPPATGSDDWSWQDEGPGRGTHYFQKLKEVWPSSHSLGAVVVHPYDLYGSADHREEVIAISPPESSAVATLHIYYNSEPLPSGTFARPSPRGSLDYRRYRQSQILNPFSFQEMAVPISRFVVQPTNGLPSRVAGLDDGGSVQFEALIEFAEGDPTDVSNLVTWDLDAASVAQGLSISATGLVSVPSGKVISGRVRAKMIIEGEERYSEPSYVFSSNSDEPEILRAGYRETWLVDDPTQDDRVLLLEAFVGQRDNLTPTVFTLEHDGTPWGPELRDNGLNGDVLAEDGIYTRIVADPPGLAAGANFVVIRAMLAPIAYGPGGQPISGNSSSPWPYFDLGGQGALPFPALPTATPPFGGETNAYKAPRVASLGYRGWNIAGELLLEVELERSAIRPEAQAFVIAIVPGLPGFQVLADEGGGIYTLQLDTGTAPPGLYLLEMAGVSVEDGAIHYGAFDPWVWLHSYPPWDIDEPADFDPAFTECEPSGW